MSLDIPSQEEFEQLVSEKSREESWDFEEAEQLLYLIQLYKLLNTSTLEPPTILDDNVLASTLKESTALLKMGLRTQKLQDISSKLSNLPKKYVASAAIALTTSTSPAITPALTMISPFAPLAAAAIPFFVKKIPKNKKDTKQVVLNPAEVAAYAKLHGRWLDIEKKPVKNVQESMNPSDTSVQSSSVSLSAGEVQSQKPEDYESRILLLNSLKLYGVATNLILPQISPEDLKCLLKLISPPETPDPAHLAGKNDENRKRKVKAINFMLQQIKSKCICNHFNLAKFALANHNEWNDDKPLSLPQLKELSILIVPPERRYSSNQHTKNPLYDSTQCKCQQPNHKPASRPAKTPKKP